MLNIKFSQGPSDAEEVISCWLKNNTHANGPLGTLKNLDLENINIGAHHPIYDMSLKDIGAGKNLDSANYTSSRYLIAQDANALAAAEVSTKNESSTCSSTTLKAINTGPFVGGFEQAIRDAESIYSRDKDKEKLEYTCQILRIAPMYVMALWLKPKGCEESIIMPIQPAPAFLCQQTYSEQEFLKSLKPHSNPPEMPN